MTSPSNADEETGVDDPEHVWVVDVSEEGGSYARQTFGKDTIAFIWDGNEYNRGDAWISAEKDDFIDIEDIE